MSEVEQEKAVQGLTLPEWLRVSSSPHLRTEESVERIMWTVNATLAPAALWGIYIFGWRAAAHILICTLTAVLTEYVIQKLRKVRVTALDGSAFLTGLLLAFCLPPGLDLWMSALGSAFAIFVAKHAFGGLGQNIFNPAHIGRAFLLASFPVAMTTWTVAGGQTLHTLDNGVQGTTGATPLGVVKEYGFAEMQKTFGSGTDLYWRLFSGDINGCIGEVSALLLILGGLFLIYKRYIRWEAPVIYIGVTALLWWILPGRKAEFFSGDPLFAALSGGLVLGAFYMITDYVTTPITRGGQIIFAAGAALLVWLIRSYGGYPEGVCYSILLMNCFSPLIDRLLKPKRYGVVKGKATP